MKDTALNTRCMQYTQQDNNCCPGLLLRSERAHFAPRVLLRLVFLLCLRLLFRRHTPYSIMQDFSQLARELPCAFPCRLGLERKPGAGTKVRRSVKEPAPSASSAPCCVPLGVLDDRRTTYTSTSYVDQLNRQRQENIPSCCSKVEQRRQHTRRQQAKQQLRCETPLLLIPVVGVMRGGLPSCCTISSAADEPQQQLLL